LLARRISAGIALVALAACSRILGDLDRVIAIEISGGSARTLEEGDTLTLTAAALDASGDTVPDAAIFWAVIDTGQVGFELDSATGLVTGVMKDTKRVQARVEGLRSGPITVSVVPAADSIAPASDTVVTTPATAAASPALQVQVLDLTTDPDMPAGLAGQTVSYRLAAGPLASVFLSVGETEPVGDGSAIEATTTATGIAAAVVRAAADATPPDTVLVEASAATAAGQTVAGTPVRFVVVFEK
jgi:hypothetical protein